jgi:hypothetical protein
MKRTIWWILAWIYTVIMFIVTLPLGLSLYLAAADITFTEDELPRFYTGFIAFLTWPLAKLENAKS